jgi:hypothetical protein
MTETNYFKAVSKLIIIFIIGVAVLVVSSWLINRSKEPMGIEEINNTICQPSYESYQQDIKKGQYVNLLENAPSYASQKKFVKDYSINIKRTGEIVCGYLYVRARNNGQPLDKKYNSIYVNPQNLGGHLLLSRSITISNPVAKTTEILLPLSAIPFLPKIPYDPTAQNYRIADWSKLLNVTDQINFRIGLSTQELTGVIDEIKIAYTCWNPQSGKITHDCQLSIIK